MPALHPAVFRARYHFREDVSTKDIVNSSTLSRGAEFTAFIQKAPDDLEVAAAIDRLSTKGVPIVKLVIDLAN